MTIKAQEQYTGLYPASLKKMVTNPALIEKLKNWKAVFISLFVAEITAKGASDKFAPYISSLPTDLSNFPVYWPASKFSDHPKGDWLRKMSSQRNRAIADDYATMLEADPSIEKSCSFLAFKRFMTLFRSRGFGAKDSDSGLVAAMVPLGDLVNHGYPSNVKWSPWSPSETDDTFFYTATRDISRGEQLTQPYKHLPMRLGSHLFLEQYGFEGTDPEDLTFEYIMADPTAYGKNLEILYRLLAENGEMASAVRAGKTNNEFKEAQGTITPVDYVNYGVAAMDCARMSSRDPGDYDRAKQAFDKVRVCTE